MPDSCPFKKGYTMAIQTKNKKIIIRISEKEKILIDKIREVDSNFNLSYFVRDKIIEKYSQMFPSIGVFKIG